MKIRTVREEIRGGYPEMVRFRRDLHQHPERGFEERRTAGLVAERLRDARLDEVQTGIATTGVRGVVRAGKPRAICLRADMDALPLQEETGAEYASIVPGVMHACGHDGHTAILAETARLLQASRERLDGDLVLIFQPAEEGPGGALPMIEAGVLQNPAVEAAFGLHLWTGIPVRQIGVTSGPAMAAADEFEIRIQGKGGHGAFPHTAVDAVIAGSHLVTALQTLVSRETNPMQTAVVTIGSFHAGSNFNIIAESAVLRGTLRTFDVALRDQLVRRLREISEGVVRSLGAECMFTFIDRYPATVNNPILSDFVAEIAGDVVGSDQVVRDVVMMGAEDMSYFLREAPGCYFFVGAGNEETGHVHPHHSPRFDFDEEAMAIGCEMFLRIAERYFDRFPRPVGTAERMGV